MATRILRLAFRAALIFSIVVALETGTIGLGWFGDQPVIPAAFFACVNVFFCILCLPMTLLSTLAMFQGKRFSWLWFAALLLNGASCFYGFALVGSVLFQHV
jgi:hypothetical protein